MEYVLFCSSLNKNGIKIVSVFMFSQRKTDGQQRLCPFTLHRHFHSVQHEIAQHILNHFTISVSLYSSVQLKHYQLIKLRVNWIFKKMTTQTSFDSCGWPLFHIFQHLIIPFQNAQKYIYFYLMVKMISFKYRHLHRYTQLRVCMWCNGLNASKTEH